MLHDENYKRLFASPRMVEDLPSPFRDAVVLTMDGVGEWATTTVGVGHGNDLTMTREIHFPHSLRLLYSAFTYYTGFKVSSGEYKVMGLAPCGEPKYAQTILDRLIDLKPDGTFRLDLDYIDYCTVHHETNPRYHDLFQAFGTKAGCPVLVNTSFNVRGEPIVCTPADAFRRFMGTDIDRLAIGNCFLGKEQQDPALRRDHADSVEPD